MRKLYYICALFFVLSIQAQNPAAIDLTFNAKLDKLKLNGDVKKCFPQSDGKVVLWGSFTGYYIGMEYFPCNSILRLNSDMTVDTSFQVGQKISNPINGVGMQSTNKLVISLSVDGLPHYYDGTLVPFIFRLNTDGTLDNTFINGTSNGTLIFGVTATDKILYRTGDTIHTARLNSDGSYDNTYTPIGTGYGIYNIQPDGGLLFASTNVGTINRISSSGIYLPDYNTFMNCSITSLFTQPDGKVLVGGIFNKDNLGNDAKQLVRLNANGTIDNTFTSLGFDITNLLSDNCQASMVNFIETQPDGKILLAGNFSSYGTTATKKIIRLNADGSLDSTFHSVTEFTTTEIVVFKLMPNGTILVGTHNQNISAPSFNSYEVTNFFSLDSNGDLSNEERNVVANIETILKSNNTYILLGERRSAYHRGIKIVDSNGATVYNPNLKNGFDSVAFGGSTLTGVVQPDGKILIGGYFSQYNGIAAKNLIRLNSDLTVDPTFNIGTGFSIDNGSSCVRVMTLQADGKIIVAGSFNTYNGQSITNGCIRLNADGSLDNSFSFGGSEGSSIYKIIALNDGKILFSEGTFNTGIRRFNSNGALDTSFTAITSGYGLFCLQSDGKIINQGKRYNPNGSIDSSFNEFNDFSSAIAVQGDDKILTGSNNIVRFNADGTFDAAFDGRGFNSNMSSILPEPDGKIVVTGYFSRYDGAFCSNVVRLVGGEGFLIEGQDRFDSDNNGCDENDIAFPNMKLHIATGANTSDFITNTTGNYSITVAPGTYTVTPIPPNANFSVSPTSAMVTFPAASNVFTQNFCLTAIGIHPDLEVTMIPLLVPRPGFVTKYKIIYKNKGNQLQSGTVNLNFDDNVINYFSATPAVNSQSTNNLSWNFTNLLPLEQREIIVQLKLNSPTQTPPLNSGAILNYTTTITSSSTDETPNDNTFTFHQTVVNSFDPNDKTCLEGATISNTQIGDFVHYVIRFENKGTYNAQNISVKDVIDTSKFDINTLTPISGSHLFITSITESNKVEFYFKDINLPYADATNDGYVEFKIKTKSTLVAGDSFSNAAAIYFDYNSPINTNTATTVIQTLAVTNFAFDHYFTIYPNPANNLLNIDKKDNIEITSLYIFNTLGQLIMTIPNAQKTSTIDVSSLRSGNYFLRINSDKGISNTKFIKL